MATNSKNTNSDPPDIASFKNLTVKNTTTTLSSTTNYNLETSEIVNSADSINTLTKNNHKIILDNGLFEVESKLGKIKLSSNNPEPDAILLKNTNPAAGITLDSGSNGIAFNTTGNVNISADGQNINIGSDNTNNITIDANNIISINSDAFNNITSDDIILKSTLGEIILDTNISTPNYSTLRCNTDGNIIINGNTTDSNFQTEIHVTEENASSTNRNGLLVLSKDANVTPEVRISYANADNSNRIINTMGVYSETSSVAEFRKYYGFHYDNKLVALEGFQFQDSDIGRKVVFKQDGRITTISNLSTLIMPADSTNSNSTATVSGTYTGSTNKFYKIEIDGVKDLTTGKTSDTFRWSNDAGATYSNTFIPLSQAVSPLEYTLEDGIKFSVDKAEDNELGDFMSFNARIIALVADSYTVDGTTETEKINNALKKSQTYITTSPFNAFFGTTTNHDMILKTAEQERFRITADGSIGASKDKIDARLHLTSEVNKVKQVNENIVTSGVNLVGNQMNSSSATLNTGGYIIVYETLESNGSTYDIYGDYFTANGEKVGNTTSFKINDELLYNQSHPHIAASGDVESDNYAVVWASQDPDNTSYYQIKSIIFENGTSPKKTTSTLVSLTTSKITLTPRVTGLPNGNYVVVYTSLADETSDENPNEVYTIKYVILDSSGNIIRSERTVSDVTSGLNHTYPFVMALDASDSNTKYAGGFVISYMKEVFSQDNRYQIVYKIYTADGKLNTPEHEITTTGYTGEVGFLNADFNLSDSRMSLIKVPRNIAVTDGGFMVAYQTNFSSSVAFVTNPTRNVLGVSSGAVGTLASSTIDSTTGIHTIVVNRTNGNFLDGELIYLQSTIGGSTDYFLEKVETVSSVIVDGFRTSTIVLSKDPKQVVIARYSTEDIDNDSPSNIKFRTQINTTTLVNDKELAAINANDSTPMDFVRANSIYYAYRSMPVIQHNNDDKGICTWQSGSEPNIYYQQFSLTDGTFIDIEELIAESTLGYRQTDPYISLLKTSQGNLLGYTLCFTSSSLDGSGTGIYQQLLGPFSYLFHMNNDNAEFVLDHNARLGIGTKEPESDIHIKSTSSLNKRFVDQVSMTMQNSSNHINNQDDLHKISFKDGSGDELGRIKVKYANGYQDMNPDADNLIAFFKLDEEVGSLIAVDSGLYNLQVNTDVDLISSSRGASGLLKGFDVNECWKDGVVNNGLEFNGLTSYLLIPRNGDNNTYVNTIDELHSSSFTISYWLKIDTNVFTGTRMDILSFGTADLSDGYGAGSGFFQLSLRDNDTDGKLRPAFGGLFSINGDETALVEKTVQVTSDTGIVNDGSWHNLLITHTRTLDGNGDPYSSRFVIYLDNTEVANSDSTFGSDRHLLGSREDITRDRDVYIGSGVGGTKNYFRGMLDELRFYRSVINTSGIGRIYKYGSELRSQLQIQTLGNNQGYTDLEPSLTIDDTGSIVGGRFKNNIARQLSGIVKVALLTPSYVDGVANSTRFISEVQPGDNLFLDLTPDGQDSGMALAGNFYQVEEVISDSRIKLNRNVGVNSDTYYSYVTIRPSILSAYDDNDLIRMNMDFNGDVVIGDGKSNTDLTKLEIRGDGSSRISKHSLTLTNTNTTTSTFYDNNARQNKVQFKAYKSSTAEVMMGALEVAHSNTNVSDDKSVLNILLNDGTRTTYDELRNVASFYGSGKFNFRNNILESNMLNDIQLNGRLENGGESIKMAFFSNEPATGVFTESSHINFFGNDSIDRNQNTNDNSALVKILVSNDKLVLSNEDDTSLVNGRIDFKINSQTGSAVNGLKSRMCLTSGGYTGIHITRPDVTFDVGPEFAELKLNDNPITTVDTNNNYITFTDNDPDTAPLFSTSDSKHLRAGRLVINDGSNLTSYVISSGVSQNVINGNSNLVIDSNEVLDSNLITGKEYTLHYPGLKVNKYGLVGIGDSRFDDDNTDYHLSVSGNTCIKGELHLASNIDVLDTSNISTVAFKATDAGELMIKDSTTDGYVKAFGGALRNTLNKYATSTTLSYDDATVLINNTTDIQVELTIPDTSSLYSGRMFNIKKISSLGNVKITCNDGATIDGFAEQFLENQYSALTIQTDGSDWYVISSHLVPDDISGLLS